MRGRPTALAAGFALSGLLLAAITAFMPVQGSLPASQLAYGLPFGFVVTHPDFDSGALIGFFSWTPSKDEAQLALLPFAASWLFWATVSAAVVLAARRWWRRIAIPPR
jgi:predicted anti-sigma-YlaC factor YlaD